MLRRSRILRMTDPNWLAAQEASAARLGDTYRSQPLCIVGGLRLSAGTQAKAQRYARMLFLARDFLEGRRDVDFWDLPMMLAEVQRLGSQLDQIAELGPVAQDKLAQLPRMPDELVSSTVYELLVGAAAVQRGLRTEMLAEAKSVKTPDLRIHDQMVPLVVECKRRMGPLSYVTDEAEAVSQLYAAVRLDLRTDLYGWNLEVEFSDEVSSIGSGAFANAVRETLQRARLGSAQLEVSWGTLRIGPLLPVMEFPETRLYSPAMLQSVFSWSEDQVEWDGLVCEVAGPAGFVVHRATRPSCLKWRSTASTIASKRARGVTSLYGDAMKQIPPGETGIIYITYPEFARAAIADERSS